MGMSYLFMGGVEDGARVPLNEPPPPKWHISTPSTLVGSVEYQTYYRYPLTITNNLGQSVVTYVYVLGGYEPNILSMLVEGYRRLDIDSYDGWLAEVREINQLVGQITHNQFAKAVQEFSTQLVAVFNEGKDPSYGYRTIRHLWQSSLDKLIKPVII